MKYGATNYLLSQSLYTTQLNCVLKIYVNYSLIAIHFVRGLLNFPERSVVHGQSFNNLIDNQS